MNKAVFTKDSLNKQMVVERLFDASVEKVWQAWTEKEILEEWWAPKPWKAVTKSFNFSEGGHWHYSMNGPTGEKSWAWTTYLTIESGRSFTAEDAFCDEAGQKSADLPITYWKNEFQTEGNQTKVTVTITFAAEEDMQKLIDMGFEAGFSMGLNNLDTFLAR